MLRLCVYLLILILTNKAACFIHHNQQHSHSADRNFSLQPIKMMRTYIFICVFFSGFLFSLRSRFVFFGIWSVNSSCLVIICLVLTYQHPLIRSHVLPGLESKKNYSISIVCSVDCLCVSVCESVLNLYYYYYYNYLDAFFSVCFQYTLNELNTRLFPVHLCRSRACACFPIHFNSIRLISIILESILWL